MHGSRQVDQYRQTGLASAVMEASPHRLITLLLAGARERAQLAAACLERGDLPRKSQAIGDACAIIGGLSGALNLEQGGEVADGLAALYDYAQRRLVESNASNDAAGLHEVDALLGDVETAWNAIAATSAQAQAAP